MNGREKRRGWIKLHRGVDPKNGELIAIDVTDEKTADSTVLPRLIKKAPKSMRKVYADGADHRKNCREILSKSSIVECIPTRKMEKLEKRSALQQETMH